MTAQSTADNWREHLLESPDQLKKLLEGTKRIAVLGMKDKPEQPAGFVPAYAQRAGYDIIPVPVYHKEATEMLGQKVYRTIAEIPGAVDMVNVFRRPSDIPPHVDDIIAKKPKSVWFQMGIRNDEAAEKLARAGIDVVQDHCLMVELKRIGK